jgi:putative DNA primase/helicase
MNAPKELLALKRWVNWDWETRKGKPTKVPKQPDGKNAKSNDETTWSTFEEVSARAMKGGRFVGRIGFMLGDGWSGVDFDECRKPDSGETEQWVLDEIAKLDSYTEVSPSLTGWKVLVKGKLPTEGRKKYRVEMFDGGKFFTLTGKMEPGIGRATVEERDLTNIHSRMMAGAFNFYPVSSPRSWNKDKSPEKISAGKTSKSEGKFSETRSVARIIGELHKELPTADAAALESAFKAQYPERYEQSLKKKSRGGKNWIRYSIERLLKKWDSPDAEPFVPRLPISELANADRLTVRFGDELRYCSDREVWCVWDKETGVWNVNDHAAVARLMQDICLGVYDEARKATSLELRKHLAAWALKSESRSVQNNSIALARVHKEIEVREFSSLFDTHSMLLNVRNGTVDLTTGKLLAHNRSDYLTKTVPIEYDAGASCPEFQNFLASILPEEKTRQYLWRALGYCLTGRTGEQKWWMFAGDTNSGKSTLVNIMHGLLGPYALALPENFFLVTNNGKDYTMANLAGIRFATCVETNEGRRLDVAKLKMLTGEDIISAELKYQNSFTFRSQAKLILATNNPPRVPASDEATWRRLQLVPFNNRVAENKIIKDLAAKLLEKEGPGILRWAVLGCVLWLAQGIGEAPEVKEASKDYRQDEDSVKHFLDEHCKITGSADDSMVRKALYASYSKWCKENHVWHLNQIPFSKECKRLGLVENSANTRKWYGVRERDLSDDVQEEVQNGDARKWGDQESHDWVEQQEIKPQ